MRINLWMNSIPWIKWTSQRWTNLEDNPYRNILFASFSIVARVRACAPQNLGCKLKATSRHGPFCGSRKSLRVTSRVAPCRPLGRTAAAEAPFLYKKAPAYQTFSMKWGGGKGRDGGVREQERQRGRRRERQRRERGNEEGRRNYGRETGRVARRSGARTREQKKKVDAKRGRRRREAGEIEEMLMENVGRKESETIGDNWRKLKWQENEIKRKESKWI